MLIEFFWNAFRENTTNVIKLLARPKLAIENLALYVSMVLNFHTILTFCFWFYNVIERLLKQIWLLFAKILDSNGGKIIIVFNEPNIFYLIVNLLIYYLTYWFFLILGCWSRSLKSGCLLEKESLQVIIEFSISFEDISKTIRLHYLKFNDPLNIFIVVKK